MAHKTMKLKSIKKKKKFTKLKIVFYLTIIYVSFAISFYYSFNSRKIVSNEEFINFTNEFNLKSI